MNINIRLNKSPLLLILLFSTRGIAMSALIFTLLLGPPAVASWKSVAVDGSQGQQTTHRAIITEVAELKSNTDIFSESLEELPAGIEVTVNAIENDWADVSVNGLRGYVYIEYLSNRLDTDKMPPVVDN